MSSTRGLIKDEPMFIGYNTGATLGKIPEGMVQVSPDGEYEMYEQAYWTGRFLDSQSGDVWPDIRIAKINVGVSGVVPVIGTNQIDYSDFIRAKQADGWVPVGALIGILPHEFRNSREHCVEWAKSLLTKEKLLELVDMGVKIHQSPRLAISRGLRQSRMTARDVVKRDDLDIAIKSCTAQYKEYAALLKEVREELHARGQAKAIEQSEPIEDNDAIQGPMERRKPGPKPKQQV